MKKNDLNKLIALFLVLGLFASCTAKKEALDISTKEKEVFNSNAEEQVEIKNEETEYEITIIEPGFYTWLQSIARPEGYYSQSFLENRNRLMVINWNQRVLQPQRFNPNLYELQINYDPNIDYGYEVNYKLYNYFIYFQRKYNQRLGPFIPRI
ncbi:hypothetical protein DKG77_12365 [Flagellimonas aquimarina]|jgi:hypothetical protein|uniref:Lipoprotein n=1 Tax=Flagellimonas aquimarina TaxID=2201895 RepID=A0A316L436_9FLAO|nr:DUF6146 family protein [Allomuricauda koreensis]PWL39013.1 hypothetical protein DKG77_12365 [Allomuricauda koreensis]